MSSQRLLAIGFGYTVLMSLFPAKEVRFLFPVLPLLNAAGGAAFAAWWSERHMAFDGRSTRASWSYQVRACVCLGEGEVSGEGKSVCVCVWEKNRGRDEVV